MRFRLTKKRIIVPFTVFLLIVNIFTAILIFFDIQVISAPKTEVFIEIVEVNSEEVILEANLKMYNSNRFDIEIKDLTITSLNYENQEIGKLKIKGGNIHSNSEKTFTEKEKIIFKESKNYTVIKNHREGIVANDSLRIV